MMFPAEHPASQHRNLIGMQRMSVIGTLSREADKLYQEGYCIDADRLADMMTELRAGWDDEID